MHMPIYLFCCKVQTIILKTIEVAKTQPYYAMYRRQNFKVNQWYVTIAIKFDQISVTLMHMPSLYYYLAAGLYLRRHEPYCAICTRPYFKVKGM